MRVSYACVCLVLSGCLAVEVRGRIDGLLDILEEAEENGAYHCAPRELAMAKSHLHFALDELEEGNVPDAEDHYIIAEPNARAALQMSPPQRCAEGRREEVDSAEPEDTDGDSIPDERDECPDAPEDADGFEDRDGCPEEQDAEEPQHVEAETCPGESCPDADQDDDGVLDTDDRCIAEVEDRDGFQDEDGCPDPDNDEDGSPDDVDRCPVEAGPRDAHGCPRVYLDVEVTDTEIRIARKIRFASGQAMILEESQELLRTIAQVLRDFPEISLEIQGHTDSRGPDRTNLRLSDARASAVRTFLISEGIESIRITSRGYGEARPIESNLTPEGRAANRRVQFMRTDPAAQQARDREIP